jgi:UDP-N-acetylglucosamine diphosphorylase/glucosamine-1-phosphate N-acetyltransferase
MNIILFDDDTWTKLLPLTFTRPVSELRVGIMTIREKWEHHLGGKTSYITQEYLAEKYPIHIEDHNYIINGSVLPDAPLIKLIEQLDHNEALLHDDILIAAHLERDQFDRLIEDDSLDEINGYKIDAKDYRKIRQLPDLFLNNDVELRNDYEALTKGRISERLPSFVHARGEDIFIEEGATLESCTLNATTGPIYIGKNATIMDGSIVRGGLAMLENSVLKMGARIYGATTLGPYSKVGGEVNNSIFQGYSNKAHDGFLGNSFIGEWCNIGADSNNSNLKNNYASVRLWDYKEERFSDTGEQFCGLFMGDHSKCAINTMFNTGTVVGVFANVFGEGFPRNFIPSFSWGGKQGFITYKFEKAMDVAQIVMGRRNMELSELDKKLLHGVYTSTSKFRSWEKG